MSVGMTADVGSGKQKICTTAQLYQLAQEEVVLSTELHHITSVPQ